jgi:hypothetical protein
MPIRVKHRGAPPAVLVALRVLEQRAVGIRQAALGGDEVYLLAAAAAKNPEKRSAS